MNIFDAIHERRSIRKFEKRAIPKDDIHKIIQAGMQAPSPKNRQPWRFVVVEGKSKVDLVHAMNKGIDRETLTPKLPKSSKYIPSVQHTISAMEQAPITILVINPLNSTSDFPNDWEKRFNEIANIQSVGACIQNMLLSAYALGYGSLWICDIDFAYEEIATWLKTDEQIVAAVSFGVPAQKPNLNTRPRNELESVVKWI